MAHRRIGQGCLGLSGEQAGCGSSLDELARVIAWGEIERHLGVIYGSARGEQAWPPLALFKALLIAVWYDLSDVKLAEALDDRASFRRFCGFAASEPTPERTAFVRFRKELVGRGLDGVLFEAVARQLEAKGAVVRKGTLIDATVIASASKGDGEALWAGHHRRKPVHGYKAHLAADADTGVVRTVETTPANEADVSMARYVLPDRPGAVYADRAYDSHGVRQAIRAAGGTPRVMLRRSWGVKPAGMAETNRAIARVRSRIEKIFGTWKRSYGLRRMRWVGLAKAALQVHLTAIAYNLKRLMRLTTPQPA